VKRLRVLIIAESANPEWVSGPLVAWSHYRSIAKLADAHLVTHVRNRAALLRASLREDEFTAIDSEWLARPVYRFAELLRGGDGRGWTTLSAFGVFSYYEFERQVWRNFRGRLAARNFDLVHRLYPISPTYPSPIASRLARLNVPFVLGPLNGGLAWPRQFWAERRQEREWLSVVRGAYRFLPGCRATRRHAAAILVGSKATLAEVRPSAPERCIYLPENGIDPALFPRAVEREPSLPLRIVFLGRLVPYKGADMLLEAAAPLMRSDKVVVEIAGDGPERPKLERLAADLGVAPAVRFSGWIPHDQVMERFLAADVFAFPSIREFGGGAVLEAMAVGLAPVVVDYGGPGELVTAETGAKVALGPRERIVKGFEHALCEFVSTPALTREIGRRARKRVFENFTWEKKAKQSFEVYRWVLGDRPNRPAFFTE
jgi:glycosyltransferase involved in cell wall biosynthesis